MEPTIDGRERRVALLVNTHSRKGRLLYRRAKSALEAHGYTLAQAIGLADPSALAQAMTTIMQLEPDLVIIGGGDGTVSSASNYLVHTNTVLGYLPLGTTNNFGRGLGIGTRLEDALDVIMNGRIEAVDVGKIGMTHFTNMVSFGVSVAVATKTPRRLKRIFGRVVYALYATWYALRQPSMAVSVTTDTAQYHFTTRQFCVASGITHSGIPIAADARLTDHKLIAYALGDTSRFSTLLATIRHSLTSHRRMAEKDLLVSPRFTLEFSPAQRPDIDGEIKQPDPQQTYHVEVVASALRVLVPTTQPK